MFGHLVSELLILAAGVALGAAGGLLFITYRMRKPSAAWWLVVSVCVPFYLGLAWLALDTAGVLP